jgi:hypothetical protein
MLFFCCHNEDDGLLAASGYDKIALEKNLKLSADVNGIIHQETKHSCRDSFNFFGFQSRLTVFRKMLEKQRNVLAVLQKPGQRKIVDLRVQIDVLASEIRFQVWHFLILL